MALGDLGQIQQAFAEAALDASLWRRALDITTRETGGFGATLLPITGSAIPNAPATEALEAVSDHYFRDGWHLRDQRMAGLASLMRAGIVDDADCTDLDGIARHPYYQEFLRPHGLRWFAGIRIKCGDEVWCLSIQRRIEQGPFPPEEKARLAALSHSLGTSAALARTFSAGIVSGALDAFEMTNTAVALVDRQGDVYRINRAAENLLNGDVRLRNRKIVTADTTASIALNRAIHDLMWGTGGASLSPPVILPRRNRQPLLAYASKLGALAANALADCQAILIFIDPEDRQMPPELSLQRAFSLTPAESRIASRLATGASLEDVSNQLQMSKLTGRTHLKRIFGKLGVKRQAELVALLSPIARYRSSE